MATGGTASSGDLRYPKPRWALYWLNSESAVSIATASPFFCADMAAVLTVLSGETLGGDVRPAKARSLAALGEEPTETLQCLPLHLVELLEQLLQLISYCLFAHFYIDIICHIEKCRQIRH